MLYIIPIYAGMFICLFIMFIYRYIYAYLYICIHNINMLYVICTLN